MRIIFKDSDDSDKKSGKKLDFSHMAKGGSAEKQEKEENKPNLSPIQITSFNSFELIDGKLENVFDDKNRDTLKNIQMGKFCDDKELLGNDKENNPNLSNGGSYKRKKICCNCKKTRCLKLYCDCFHAGLYCGKDCNCMDCGNTKDNEQERFIAKKALLDRNPSAFKQKIDVKEEEPIKHSKGCNCKKSGCLKKYCECYQANVKCSNLCKCEACKNRDFNLTKSSEPFFQFSPQYHMYPVNSQPFKWEDSQRSFDEQPYLRTKPEIPSFLPGFSNVFNEEKEVIFKKRKLSYQPHQMEIGFDEMESHNNYLECDSQIKKEPNEDMVIEPNQEKNIVLSTIEKKISLKRKANVFCTPNSVDVSGQKPAHRSSKRIPSFSRKKNF